MGIQNAGFDIGHRRLLFGRLDGEQLFQATPQGFAFRRPVVEAFADFFAHAFQVKQLLQGCHGDGWHEVIVFTRFIGGRAHGREVETGQSGGGNVIVRAGLKEGEELAVTGIEALREGMKVVNGDLSDMRSKDESGVVVGLLAKGKAKKSKRSEDGFVIRTVNI